MTLPFDPRCRYVAVTPGYKCVTYILTEEGSPEGYRGYDELCDGWAHGIQAHIPGMWERGQDWIGCSGDMCPVFNMRPTTSLPATEHQVWAQAHLLEAVEDEPDIIALAKDEDAKDEGSTSTSFQHRHQEQHQ